MNVFQISTLEGKSHAILGRTLNSHEFYVPITTKLLNRYEKTVNDTIVPIIIESNAWRVLCSNYRICTKVGKIIIGTTNFKKLPNVTSP